MHRGNYFYLRWQWGDCSEAILTYISHLSVMFWLKWKWWLELYLYTRAVKSSDKRNGAAAKQLFLPEREVTLVQQATTGNSLSLPPKRARYLLWEEQSEAQLVWTVSMPTKPDMDMSWLTFLRGNSHKKYVRHPPPTQPVPYLPYLYSLLSHLNIKTS